MTAIATVVAGLAETALAWARNSSVPMSGLVRRRISGYLCGLLERWGRGEVAPADPDR